MGSEDEDENEDYDEEGEEYIDLDLEKTLTWTGNAVIVQAGGEFRLPLIVPHPSVLAIQFEVDGGSDIEFSLLFKDDHENDYQVLVQPVRVSDREGQLDIDTTGVCELLWSNAHAWVSSKTLSYQLQLAPKLDMQKKKWVNAILTAAADYRVVSSAEAAEEVDKSLKTVKERGTKLRSELSASKEKSNEAQMRVDRYSSHVKRLEEEVAAAKRHVEQAQKDFALKQREMDNTSRSLAAIEHIHTVDEAISDEMMALLEDCAPAMQQLYEAFAGSLYAEEEQGSAPKPSTVLDRAELIHMLHELGVMRRGESADLLCGVFYKMPPTLTLEQFNMCVARASLALAPSDAEENTVLWLFIALTENIEKAKLPTLDVQRRVKVIGAIDFLADTIYEPEP